MWIMQTPFTFVFLEDMVLQGTDKSDYSEIQNCLESIFYLFLPQKKSIFEGKVYPANPNFVFHIKSTMAWRMSPSTSFGSSFKLTVIFTHTGLAVGTLTGSNLQG